jgi:hypothetical protein
MVLGGNALYFRDISTIRGNISVLSLLFVTAGSLLELLIDREHSGDEFLLIVGLSPNCTSLQLTRMYCLQLAPWASQYSTMKLAVKNIHSNLNRFACVILLEAMTPILQMAYSVLTLIRDILGSNFCRQTRYSD